MSELFVSEYFKEHDIDLTELELQRDLCNQIFSNSIYMLSKHITDILELIVGNDNFKELENKLQQLLTPNLQLNRDG
jgi:hypothetical protein